MSSEPHDPYRDLKHRRGASIQVLERLHTKLVESALADPEFMRRLADQLRQSADPLESSYLGAWLSRHLSGTRQAALTGILHEITDFLAGRDSSARLEMLVRHAFGLGLIRHNPATLQSYCHWLACRALAPLDLDGEDDREAQVGAARLTSQLAMPQGTGSNGGIERFLDYQDQQRAEEGTGTAQRTVAIFDAFLDPRGRVATEDVISGTRSVRAMALEDDGAQSQGKLGVLYCFFPIAGLFEKGAFAEPFFAEATKEAPALILALANDALRDRLEYYDQAAEAHLRGKTNQQPTPDDLLKSLVPVAEKPDNKAGFQVAVWVQEEVAATASAESAYFSRVLQLLRLGAAFPAKWAHGHVAGRDGGPVDAPLGAANGRPLVVQLQEVGLRPLLQAPIRSLEIPLRSNTQPLDVPALGSLRLYYEGDERQLDLTTEAALIAAFGDAAAALAGFLEGCKVLLGKAASAESIKGLFDIYRGTCAATGRSLVHQLDSSGREVEFQLAPPGEIDLLSKAISGPKGLGSPDVLSDLLRKTGDVRIGRLTGLPSVQAVSIWSHLPRYVVIADGRPERYEDRLFLADEGLLDTVQYLVEFYGRSGVTGSHRVRLDGYRHTEGPIQAISPAFDPVTGQPLTLVIEAATQGSSSLITRLTDGADERACLEWQLLPSPEPLFLEPKRGAFRKRLASDRVTGQACFAELGHPQSASEEPGPFAGPPIKVPGFGVFQVRPEAGREDRADVVLAGLAKAICGAADGCNRERGLCEFLRDYADVLSRPDREGSEAPTLAITSLAEGLPSADANRDVAPAKLLTLALGRETRDVQTLRAAALRSVELRVQQEVRNWKSRLNEAAQTRGDLAATFSHSFAKVGAAISQGLTMSDPRQIIRALGGDLRYVDMSDASHAAVQEKVKQGEKEAGELLEIRSLYDHYLFRQISSFYDDTLLMARLQGVRLQPDPAHAIDFRAFVGRTFEDLVKPVARRLETNNLTETMKMDPKLDRDQLAGVRLVPPCLQGTAARDINKLLERLWETVVFEVCLNALEYKAWKERNDACITASWRRLDPGRVRIVFKYPVCVQVIPSSAPLVEENGEGWVLVPTVRPGAEHGTHGWGRYGIKLTVERFLRAGGVSFFVQPVKGRGDGQTWGLCCIDVDSPWWRLEG